MVVAEATRPSYSGVYPVQDATLFISATTPLDSRAIRLNSRHLFHWVREGLSGEYLQGLRGDEVALTFLDLITMRMIAAFRSHGVSPAEIRTAHKNLKQLTGWTHPFAMQPMWVSGPNVFIRKHGSNIAIAKWQPAFDFIEEFLAPVHNILFDRSKQASSWEPEPGVVLDPKVSFGSPCIKGTRIQTETIWALHEAGDSIELIADAYGLSRQRVKSALAWEYRLEQSAA